ncbi:hypothetical protein CspHIS471_0305340 [Cutaneotrichosporon sp. HIS471]|nr:hypothetical protein CspHIS471_0305340 [Cutaneotrichosporon sp. HIS471]
MPKVPSVSPVTGKPVPPDYLHASDIHFQDTQGRSVLLRGINFTASAKAPPGQPSQSQDGFWEDAERGDTSWVGAMGLNVEDGSADIHLARLRAWGYNMLRFVFTWESLEHAGPGKYDYAYMDYVVKVLYKCKEWGFRVNMDPHQDVWSRFSGGSGAPLWTIYACGVDPQNIVPTYSALVQCDYPSKEAPDPGSMPAMIWASNYYRAFGHTVWTLFFGGKEFAPKCTIDGKNVQDFLQDHFIDAVGELVKVVAAAGNGELLESCVLGWDSINEPAEGLIGVRDVSQVPKDQPVRLGPVPTPFESMRLAMGESLTVDNYKFTSMGPSKTGTVSLDPKGTRLWISPADDAKRGAGRWGWKRGGEWEVGTCIWAQHGVWDPTTKTLLKPAYFHTLPTDASHEVEFVYDFWRQHWMSYASSVRTHHPDAVHFMNTSVFKPLPPLPESFLSGRACSTPHFYDGLTLMTKHWNWFNADALGILRGKYWSIVQGLRVGEAAIRNVIQEQLGVLKEDTKKSIGRYPTMMGEIGCPYDQDGCAAYGYVDGGKGKGDYTAQTKSWDASMNGHDGPNSLNYTLWNYTPTNSHQWGDGWNGEDLSIWSPDDCKGASYKTERSLTESAATLLSTASTATLRPSLVTPKGIDDSREITPELLLDGMRAIGAVCRPYPVATVGAPSRIDFDIYTSVFRLSVTVGPEDGGDGTIIYLPFVHYARELEWVPGGEDGSELSSCGNSTSNLLDSDVDDPKALKVQAPLKLGIEVRTTAGEYRFAGQFLTWTYPIPARQTTYTIEIRRARGVLAHNARTEEEWSMLSYIGCTIA